MLFDFAIIAAIASMPIKAVAAMSTVTEHFLRYIAIDTTSQEGSTAYPSTENQLRMGELLTQELRELGLHGGV